MLHLAGCGSWRAFPLDVLVELRVGDLDGRDARVDAERDDVIVDQLADLLADLGADQALMAAVAVACLRLDVGERLRIVDEGQPLGPGKDHIEGRQELLELDVELCPQLLLGGRMSADTRRETLREER